MAVSQSEVLSALEGLLSEALLPSGLAAVVELITVGDDGLPFCCLLSRRQIVVREGEVLALVHGRRPNANLAARGLATLSFAVDNTYGSLEGRVSSSRPLSDGTLWVIEVLGGRLERGAEVLLPMSYWAPELDEAEGPALFDLLE